MKTDYLFLNRILTGISEKQSHIVDVLELSEEVKQPHLAIGNDEYLDKFYGHLQLLKDAGAIVELCGRDLGVYYLNDGKFNCSDCQIRLTAAGYDLAKLLEEKNFVEKLKKMTVSSVVFAAKAAAEKGIDKLFDSF